MADESKPTKTPPLKLNEWQIHGRCLNRSASKTAGAKVDQDGVLTIREQPSSLRWIVRTVGQSNQSLPPNDESFGKPIDVKLAVSLIKGALDSTADYLAALDKAKNLSDEHKETAKNLLNLPYGITFDKTIIMKILSQPNCAALRSYVCERPDKHVSLVLVGVDSDGYDLNFAPPITDKNAIDRMMDLTDPDNSSNSLIAEYGYPPNDNKVRLALDINKTTDPHYILLKMAKGEAF